MVVYFYKIIITNRPGLGYVTIYHAGGLSCRGQSLVITKERVVVRREVAREVEELVMSG